MFTGIIEDLGTVDRIKHSSDGAVISVRTALPMAKIAIGESIAVSGCCLTVVRKARGVLAMDISAETLRRTILGDIKPGDRVNLERCLTVNKLLGGHLVSGHVDGIGRIVSITPEGDSRLYTFEVGPDQSRYLVEKGSVALDGVSLTVFGIRGPRFKVALIPHTLKMTTLGYKDVGSTLNVESDMLVKYVEQILGESGLRGRNGRKKGKSADQITGDSRERRTEPRGIRAAPAERRHTAAR
ncbi:MAG: riboflavin synthase [Deltaproteobacteria bacterium]|nr:riboflavin synthase [Deltaproteobacteria bacterium]